MQAPVPASTPHPLHVLYARSHLLNHHGGKRSRKRRRRRKCLRSHPPRKRRSRRKRSRRNARRSSQWSKKQSPLKSSLSLLRSSRPSRQRTLNRPNKKQRSPRSRKHLQSNNKRSPSPSLNLKPLPLNEAKQIKSKIFNSIYHFSYSFIK